MSINYTVRRVIEALELDGDSIRTPLPSTEVDNSVVGSTARMTNTIKLKPDSSSTNNYYLGYDVVLHKTQDNGKPYIQKKRIVAYNGATKIAIIDDLWDTGYEPEENDYYELVLSHPDMRISINPVLQTFDYVRSSRYGRGLDAEADFYLNTVKETAKKSDARSDVSLKHLSQTDTFEAGERYELKYNSKLVWEGKVHTTSQPGQLYVYFTDTIGKITNKWFDWKYYEAGDIIYTDEDRLYRVLAYGLYPIKPTHESGSTSGNLEHLTALSIQQTNPSNPGADSMQIDISKNPVLSLNEEGVEVSGYSLYDSDSINFWRRLGWDTHSQDSVTQFQTNFTIDTSVPMFDNINMMLEHFNGIFSYSQGKYAFNLEEIIAEENFVPVTEDDVIGKISIVDSGNTKAFNSLSVSYSDPANNFESRNISLFSKNFLEQDRNVPKKGNLTVTGITNYYNVRLLADSYLHRSRKNLSIRMTLFPEFITLVPGSVIGITYGRFTWTNKPFRIDSMTIEENGLITVVANEYSDEFYSVTPQTKTEGVGNRSAVPYTPIPSPSNLSATNTVNNNELKNGIQLDWINAPNLTPATTLEIYASDVIASELFTTSISNNIVTFNTNHNLKEGSSIKAINSGNGFTAGTVYYVIEIVSPTEIKVSTVFGGAETTLTNGSNLNNRFSTYILVGSVAYPENQFLHTFPNITESVVKYYKIRYRVTK